jgi:ArsR family transcriptional regulator
MTTLTILSKEELKEKIDRKEDFQLINVLETEFYHLGSIKGSKRIPLVSLKKRLGELDKTKEVVVYCASYACQTSKIAAELLSHHGFRVIGYEGGIKEWKEAGFPVEYEKEAASKNKSKGS